MAGMPIFEYTCTACEHRFEELVSSSGGTLVACPQCASADVSKLFSSFATKSVGGDMPRAAMGGGGGGCCGGGCGCRH
jgi:putative FmdB family regulatory protein